MLGSVRTHIRAASCFLADKPENCWQLLMHQQSRRFAPQPSAPRRQNCSRGKMPVSWQSSAPARRVENAAALAAVMQPRFSFPVVPVQDAETAARDADIIVTATTSREPVLRRDWISPGAHINAVGTYAPTAREIDTATMAEGLLFVDRRESALNEAGDYLIAAQEGAIGPEHIRAELGEILIGACPGRTSREEITIFKSLGLAIEDLAAAAHVYQKARNKNQGTWVEFD